MNLNEFRARLKQLRAYKAEMERRLKKSPMCSGMKDYPMPAPLPNSLKQKTLNKYADLGEQIISEYRDPNIDHDAEWYKKYYRLADDIADKAKDNAWYDVEELWLNQISNKPGQILYNTGFSNMKDPCTRFGCRDAYMDPIDAQRQFIFNTLDRLQRQDRSR